MRPSRPLTATASPTDGSARVDRRFVAVYTLAQIGAFIGFVPLLSVLLPLKATALAPAGASLLLSQAAICGAVAAGLSHLAFGALSDRTRSRLGRRKPWILAGTALTAVSYAGVFLAGTAAELIGSVVLFQVAFNMLFAPLGAIFADHVPDARKGLVSAFSGLAYPAASLFAALVIAVGLAGATSRYLTVAASMIVLVLPVFAVALREPPATDPATRRVRRPLLSALADRDFRLAFLSRLTVQTAISLNALYLFFYLQTHSDAATRLSGMRPDAVLGLLIAAATAAALLAGFGAGILSDRRGGRKGFVTAGALGIAGGAALLALWPAWPGPLAAQMLYGAGLGVFTTADQALIAQVLPRREDAGRDLGIMNLAVTLPQVLAPLAGIALHDAAGWSLRWVFAVAAALALTGGLLVQAVRRRL